MRHPPTPKRRKTADFVSGRGPLIYTQGKSTEFFGQSGQCKKKEDGDEGFRKIHGKASIAARVHGGDFIHGGLRLGGDKGSGSTDRHPVDVPVHPARVGGREEGQRNGREDQTDDEEGADGRHRQTASLREQPQKQREGRSQNSGIHQTLWIQRADNRRQERSHSDRAYEVQGGPIAWAEGGPGDLPRRP